jgi:site-specific recombinase XerD
MGEIAIEALRMAGPVPELVQLNLDQVEPSRPEALRQTRRARIHRVAGKGKTKRRVFLSSDARQALADYLERERPDDVGEGCTALFLSAASLGARRCDGRLSPRAVNLILDRLGRWHDAELADPKRWLSPLRPHDLRHCLPAGACQRPRPL